MDEGHRPFPTALTSTPRANRGASFALGANASICDEIFDVITVSRFIRQRCTLPGVTALGDSFTSVLNQENKMNFPELNERQKETVAPFKSAGSTVPAMALGATGQQEGDVLGVTGEG